MEINLRHFLVDWLNYDPENAFEALANHDIRVAKDERYPNLFCLKYGSIMADKGSRIVQACRGAVVERDKKGKFSLVAYAFDRFFNLGEGHCHNLDWDNVRVYEKYDGCLHGDTMIQTTKGEKAIREICEDPEGILVYGLNHFTGKRVEVPVEAVSVKNSGPDTQCYKITLENGKTLTLTGNHEIWDNNTESYVRVDELTGEEELSELN